MIVQYSPLVSQASGKAGPIVASRWKGINYFRELVIPANPNSLGEFGQAEHRARARMMVYWWQDMPTQFTDFCKVLASGLPLSGFNMFYGQNLRLISLGTKLNRKSAEDPILTPIQTLIEPVATFVASSGAGEKEIDLTWTAGDATGTHYAYVAYGACDADGDLPLHLELGEADTTEISALTTKITMPEATAWYFLALLVENGETNEFSVALVDWAQSNA